MKRGHACHFRCDAEPVQGLRVDVISVLRGCGPFNELWKRKKTVSIKKSISIDIIGLTDLLASKKTQRDKDWLMLKRLVQNDILLNKNNPSVDRVKWWLLESRDPESLIGLGKEYPKILKANLSFRPLLSLAIDNNLQKLESELRQEELKERQKDAAYWAPLKRELEILRHNAKN